MAAFRLCLPWNPGVTASILSNLCAFIPDKAMPLLT